MILCNRPLNGGEFTSMLCNGDYFYHCDTFAEVKEVLRQRGVFISDGISLNELSSEDLSSKNLVLVSFSTEENYTEYEYRWIPIRKRYFKRFMRELEISQN